MKSLIRTSTSTYSFIETEFDGTPEETVEMAKKIHDLWSKPCKGVEDPKKLGETYTNEHGHVYKAVENQQTGRLFWMIDKPYGGRIT